MTPSELWRRVSNIITTAKVIATKAKDGKALVKVEYDTNCISDWLPMAMTNNGLIKVWIPPTVGEQVTVLRAFGNSDSGIVFRSIFNRNSKEPIDANEKNIIILLKDETKIEHNFESKITRVDFLDKKYIQYDAENSELKINTQTVSLECDNLTVTGEVSFQKSLNISDSLSVGSNITTDGKITDMLGDLTNFTTTNKGKRVPS